MGESPHPWVDSEETSSVLSRRGFHREVGPEGACSGLEGDWKVTKGKHSKTNLTGRGGNEVGLAGSLEILLAGLHLLGDIHCPWVPITASVCGDQVAG